MKIFFEGYPFCPKTGKILSSDDESRVERYYKLSEFKGDYFDIVFYLDDDGDNEAYSISSIKVAE
jgi:hypothetical protein